MQEMKAQAARFGTEFAAASVEGVRLHVTPSR
jgi:hypothetical protein